VVLILSGLIVGTFSHFSSRQWGWGRYVVAVLAAEFLSLMMNSAGALSDASTEA
jgi:hypothetical protein